MLLVEFYVSILDSNGFSFNINYVCWKRKNCDARYPDTYAKSIFSEIDLIYQDVAQPNQAEIAIANSSYYLKKNGLVMLAIKSQSIDSISKSEKVYNQEKNKLVNAGYEVVDSIDIHRYTANHIVLMVKKIN